MNLNDPAELDRIQAVCDAATSEPWTLDKPECDAGGWAKGVAVAGTPGRQTIYANPPGGSFPRADSVFIALARTALPLAIAALRERAWRPIESAPNSIYTAIDAATGEEAWQVYYETEGDEFIRIEVRGAEIVLFDKEWDNDDIDPRERLKMAERIVAGAAAITALAASEAKVRALTEALERIERGCSFPEDDVQRAVRDAARSVEI